MTNIKDKPGGRPAKKRIEKQQRVVSTKLTELQYYAIRKRAGEAGLRVSEYVRQAGRGSQQHQPTGAPSECRRFRTGGGGTGETQKQDCRNYKSVVG